MELVFPNGDYAGVIFDCDGTLVDSMPVHYRAWEKVLEIVNHPRLFSEEAFYDLGGVPTDRLVEILNERAGTAHDPEELSRLKEEIYLDLLPEVAPIEPVVRYARSLAEKRPISVASGGEAYVVDRALVGAGLRDLFPVVVTADQVEHGKPAPDMFLLAAERMGVDPAGCLVLEDAELGRQAAVAAGMDCMMIPNALERRKGEEALRFPPRA